MAPEIGQDEAFVKGTENLRIEEVRELQSTFDVTEQQLVQDQARHPHQQLVGTIAAVNRQRVPAQAPEFLPAQDLHVSNAKENRLEACPAPSRHISMQEQSPRSGFEDAVHNGVLGAFVVAAAHPAAAAGTQPHGCCGIDPSPHESEVLLEGLVVAFETTSALGFEALDENGREEVVNVIELLTRQSAVLTGFQSGEGVGEHVVDVLQQHGAGATRMRPARIALRHSSTLRSSATPEFMASRSSNQYSRTRGSSSWRITEATSSSVLPGGRHR